MCEVFGLEFCTVSLYDLNHILEDVLNFATADNFWCATFERAVEKYIVKPTNKKGLKKSHIQSEE